MMIAALPCCDRGGGVMRSWMKFTEQVEELFVFLRLWLFVLFCFVLFCFRNTEKHLGDGGCFFLGCYGLFLFISYCTSLMLGWVSGEFRVSFGWVRVSSGEFRVSSGEFGWVGGVLLVWWMSVEGVDISIICRIRLCWDLKDVLGLDLWNSWGQKK